MLDSGERVSEILIVLSLRTTNSVILEGGGRVIWL